jgi:tetratricopeptide (TPR) repeat protein
LYHEYVSKYDDAIADYTRALAEDADFSSNGMSPEECRAHAYHYRGRMYQWQKKDNLKAAEDYTQALRLDPEIRMVFYRRGQAYHELKLFAKAHEDFQAAFEKRPEYPNLLNSWAWQLATCPDEMYRDGNRVLEFAQKTKNSNVLAAALAGFKKPRPVNAVR